MIRLLTLSAALVALAMPAFACKDFDDAMNELEQKNGTSHHAANTVPQAQQTLPQSTPANAQQAAEQPQQQGVNAGDKIETPAQSYPRHEPNR